MKRADLSYSPAEAHGIACGMCCAHLPKIDEVWAAEIYSELNTQDVIAEECRFLLDHLFTVTQAQLAEMEFEFQLFLPEFEDAPPLYGAAISDWCQGFLFGLGLAGEERLQQLSEEAQESMGDISEISRVSSDDIEDNEEDQEALVEVEEYLRVAAMLMYNDMAVQSEEDHESE